MVALMTTTALRKQTGSRHASGFVVNREHPAIDIGHARIKASNGLPTTINTMADRISFSTGTVTVGYPAELTDWRTSDRTHVSRETL